MSNLADEMAYRRTAWALERTQLAWVRTAFAVITTGLALDQGVSALHQAQLLEDQKWVRGGHVLGIGLAVAAAIQLVVATLVYVRRDRELAATQGFTSGKIPPCLPLSAAVTFLGLTIATLLTWWG